MNKYNKSKIYKIISNIEPKYYYIGSTITELNVRLNRHKTNSKISPNTKIYKYLLITYIKILNKIQLKIL